MKRPVRLPARIDTPGVIDVVFGSIPAPPRQVQTAGKGNAIVNDDNLLVLRGSQRNAVVEAEMNTGRRLPLQCQQGEGLALGRIKERVVPEEKIDVEGGPLVDQRAQECRQVDGIIVFSFSAFADKPRPAVEVPAGDHNGMLGCQGCLPHGAEEGRTVDQNGETVRPLDAPNICVGHKNGHADWGPEGYLCRARNSHGFRDWNPPRLPVAHRV